MRVRLVYEVEARDDEFLLEEETMPETPIHDQAIQLLVLLLQAWAARVGRDVLVARNLACRTDPADVRRGVDPDVCVIEPPPPDLDTLTQLRLWEPGHVAPWLAIEVVSESTADKDYQKAPVSYARLGTQELWIFDPKREGVGEMGGPYRVQVWRRERDRMERVYAGEGPAWSEGLGAWLVVVDGGRKLRLAGDEAGTQLWPTAAEQERAERERAEARAAQAQTERERAEAEVAELRHRLAALERQR